MIKITERGWPGHFCAASSCVFRRNTLIESNDLKIVVSTVGDMRSKGNVEWVGLHRYYETMVFHAIREGKYIEADVGREIYLDCKQGIGEIYDGVDNDANEMHENAVKEVVEKIKSGEINAS